MEQLQERIAIIGAGKLGTCIIQGLLHQGVTSEQLIATTARAPSGQSLQDKWGITTTTDNLEAAQKADVIIVAVKPQLVTTVVQQMKPALQDGHRLIISVAAGVRSDVISDAVDQEVPIVCAMPNTASSIGESATGAYANQAVSKRQHEAAHALLTSLGAVFWLPQEHLLNAVVGIAGSAPAYLFLIMEALADAGVSMGLEQTTARQLVEQTCFGAASLAQQSGLTVTELREQVTSPHGSTAQALNCLLSNDLPGIMYEAVKAAVNRTKEVEASFSKSSK